MHRRAERRPESAVAKVRERKPYPTNFQFGKEGTGSAMRSNGL